MLSNNEKVIVEKIEQLKQQFNLSSKITFHIDKASNIEEWEQKADSEILSIIKAYESQIDDLILLKERIIEINQFAGDKFEIIKLDAESYYKLTSNSKYNDLEFIEGGNVFPYERYFNSFKYIVRHYLITPDNTNCILILEDSSKNLYMIDISFEFELYNSSN